METESERSKEGWLGKIKVLSHWKRVWKYNPTPLGMQKKSGVNGKGTSVIYNNSWVYHLLYVLTSEFSKLGHIPRNPAGVLNYLYVVLLKLVENDIKCSITCI
jgi:hypothetical protein